MLGRILKGPKLILEACSADGRSAKCSLVELGCARRSVNSKGGTLGPLSKVEG